MDAILNHKFWNITVSIVDHCNFNCSNCIHFTTYRPKREYQAQDFIPSIQLMLDQGVVTDQELLLAGGEPFLHSDLNGFVEEFHSAFSLPIVIASNGSWLSDKNVEKCRSVFQKIRRLTITQYGRLNLSPVSVIKEMTRVVVRKRAEFASFSFPSESAHPDIPKVAQAEAGYCRFVDCIQLMPDKKLMKCPAGYATLSSFPTSSEFDKSKHLFYDLEHPSEDFSTWWERYPFDACYYCRLSTAQHRFQHKL